MYRFGNISNFISKINHADIAPLLPFIQKKKKKTNAMVSSCFSCVDEIFDFSFLLLLVLNESKIKRNTCIDNR